MPKKKKKSLGSIFTFYYGNFQAYPKMNSVITFPILSYLYSCFSPPQTERFLKQMPDLISSINISVYILKDMTSFFSHNHSAIITPTKLNNFLISCTIQPMFKFCRLSHKCLFTFGVFKSGPSKAQHCTWLIHLLNLL